jgi:hypothetical protein
MNISLRRVTAIAGSAVVLSSVGALANMEAANAVGVARATDGHVQIYLDGIETRSVLNSGSGSQVCGAAINTATSLGITVTDEQRSSCDLAVITCVGQAAARGNALSGVNFLPTARFTPAQYVCLIR